MAVAGVENSDGDERDTNASKSRETRRLVDQLGSTQHLDRERSRSRLRALLRDPGKSSVF